MGMQAHSDAGGGDNGQFHGQDHLPRQEMSLMAAMRLRFAEDMGTVPFLQAIRSSPAQAYLPIVSVKKQSA